MRTKRSFKEKIQNDKINLLILLLLTFVLLFCFVIPAIYFASAFVNVEGVANIKYTEYVAPPKPDINAGKEESDKINNDLGLNTSTDSSGGLVMGDSTQNGGIPLDSVAEKRKNWIDSGILSYIRYDGAICSLSAGLIVIIDFSKYYVTKFEQNCFDGLLHIFFGYKSKNTTEEDLTFEQDVVVYESKSGTFLKKEKILLDGTGVWRRYNEQTGEYEQGEAMDITFRIVLPSLQQGDTIQFSQNSLVFSNTANTISSKLVSLAIDLSYLDINEASAENRIFIHKQALGNNNGKPGKTNHLHFIGYTAGQLEYALHYTLEYTDSLKSAGCVTELFVKQNVANDFGRIYFSAETGKGNSSFYSIYDSMYSEQTQLSDIVSILSFAQWLKYHYNPTSNSINEFRHYHRSPDNELDAKDDFGTVTFGTTLADGRTEVRCTHDTDGRNGAVIGYFDQNRNFYDKDGVLLKGSNFQNKTLI